MNDQKIEQSDAHSFGQQQLVTNSFRNLISHENKSDLSLPDIYKH